MKKKKKRIFAVDSLDEDLSRWSDYEFPKVSVIIPSCNCAPLIEMTLKSVLTQEYPNFEVLVVDGGSRDHSLQIVREEDDVRLRIFSALNCERYVMLNKGIIEAEGEYLCFLFPGDYYIHPRALRLMLSLALDHQSPELVFCGALLRDGKSDVKTLFRHLSLSLLRKGQQPTALQSCWFRKDLFHTIGRFCPDYRLRGGFDLFCRFCLHKNLRAVSVPRILIDYDLRQVTKEMVKCHFVESLYIIYKHFGMFFTLRWLVIQRDMMRYLRLVGRSLKTAFLGE